MNYIHYSLSDSYPFKIVPVDIMGIYVPNFLDISKLIILYCLFCMFFSEQPLSTLYQC